MTTTADLFQSFKLGAITLTNRIVMPSLTRSRAGSGDVPGVLNATYYAQRATAGLIVSEATQISPQGKGYPATPGIYSEDQVAGWKLVTDAVHAKGGHMFAQLWHVGRISHPELQENQQLPVSASAICPIGKVFTATGFKDFVTPRALELHEISGIIQQYVHAAQNAQKAGFDGIEIHAANGYLIDQFLRDKTNQRTDNYGGCIANRARLLLEIVAALTQVFSPDRIGVRFSPVSHVNDIEDSDPMTLFTYVIQHLNQFNLAYIHCIEGETMGEGSVPIDFSFAKLRALFNGNYIANSGYTLERALQAREQNLADLISFGRPFIANPDLVDRLMHGKSLAAEAPKTTWYGNGAKGYTDWPFAE